MVALIQMIAWSQSLIFKAVKKGKQDVAMVLEA
jgi:hypothetical protein